MCLSLRQKAHARDKRTIMEMMSPQDACSLRQKAHAREVNMSALVNTAPRHAQPDEFISQIVMMFMVS